MNMQSFAAFLKTYPKFLETAINRMGPYSDAERTEIKKRLLTLSCFACSVLGLLLIRFYMLFDGGFLSAFFGIVLLGFFVFNELPRIFSETVRGKALTQMQEFLTKIKHEYTADMNMILVLKKLCFECSGPCLSYIEKYLKILKNPESRTEISEFVSKKDIPDIFRHFLIQLYSVLETGDKKDKNGESVFLSNAERLREGLINEISNEKDRKYEMLGLTIITIVPFFMLPVFKRTGCMISEGMAEFYCNEGRYVEILCLLLSMISYVFIRNEKSRNGLGKRRETDINLEISRLQLVIILEKQIPGISVHDMLKDFASFSELFGKDFEKCLCKMTGGSEEALQELKEKGIRELSEFADALIDAGNIGIEAAFDETYNNIRHNERKSEFEGRVRFEKSRDISAVLALVPAFACFGLYFALPFVIASVGELDGMVEILGELCR